MHTKWPYSSCIVTDYDIDGKADIALLSNESYATIRLLSKSGDSFYTKYYRNTPYSYPRDMVIDDFNNDGSSQEFFISVFGGANICMDFSSSIWEDPLGGTNSLSVSSGDYNADGFTDIFIGIESAIESHMYTNNGTAGSIGFTESWNIAAGIDSTDSASADLDNDGDIDIVEARSIGNLQVYNNDGTGNFSTVTYAVTKCYLIKTADIDLDGDYDIIGLSTVGVYLFANKGDGTFTQTLYNIIYAWADMDFFDIDSDGDTDIIAAATGYIVVIKNSNGSLSESAAYPVTGNVTSISLIDL